MKKRRSNAVISLLALFVYLVTFVPQDGFSQETSAKWYRGNLHTHTLWSDGDDFPEVITKRFVDKGYHFLALTDHNVLAVDKDKWMDLKKIKERSGEIAMENYLSTFGEDWIETRDKPVVKSEKPEVEGEQPEVKGAKTEAEGEQPDLDADKPEVVVEIEKQVRLRTLEEIRQRFESPEKFLLITAEEISDRADGKPIHMNAMNLRTVISPASGETVIEAINNNLRIAEEQAEKNGEPIIVQLNHPNFGWAVTAEELAAVTNERFFEVYNGHPGINHLGDETRASIETMWDIANTIRIDQLKSSPLFGTATDDSHHYHDRKGKTSRMGRGWVMVRANKLATIDLIEAMKAGDFYCSSGVELESLEFKDNRLSLKIKAEPNVNYQTQFIGTFSDYDQTSEMQLDTEGKPIKATKLYSKDIGKVLATSDSTEPAYELTGQELYVRAVVTSSEEHENSSFKDQFEQAWTQPVGWEKSISRN